MLLRTDRIHAGGRATDRGAFERDRDRILYSAQFRRLGGVTQVTSPIELHSFHNRLTHSLEVAQIARRTAERLLRRAGGELLSEHLNPDVCEAAALAHDLGHPPFGHNGEMTLDALATAPRPNGQSDLDGYEGNAQSLRILARLAKHSKEYEGLNLTAATLRASIKYPWIRTNTPEGKEGKFGAFITERNLLSQLFEGLPERNQTFEASIMDLADDVAFSVHDLYDFIMAGVIPLREIVNISAQDLMDLLAADPKAAAASRDAFENVALLLRPIPLADVRTASRFSSPLVAGLKEWVSSNITRFTDLELEVRTDGDRPRLILNNGADDQIIILKALTKYFVIASPALAVRAAGERAVLTGLFEILLDEATSERPKLLSSEVRDRIQGGDRPVRVVLDILSHMTDAQAIGLHHKLTGVTTASILDMTTPSLF